MKHIIMILVALFMSTSAFAGTTTSNNAVQTAKSIKVPTNLIVKQTITFDNGKTIEVFYEKQGETCKVYSTSDVSKYGVSDLYHIKSTNFEKTNYVEGKCYASKTVSALISMAKKFLK